MHSRMARAATVLAGVRGTVAQPASVCARSARVVPALSAIDAAGSRASTHTSSLAHARTRARSVTSHVRGPWSLNMRPVSNASASAPPEPLLPNDPGYVSSPRRLRNVAVIAHVDHGKTSLVDAIVRGADPTFGEASMDSNDLERERGITILAKATSVVHGDTTVNIVDTPGHADFGGEVERVLVMCDGVIAVVDASEGPMPQTRYVLGKAMAKGLRPIVVFNKCDRDTARIGEVEVEVFDLLMNLCINEEQMSYPTLYVSAKERWATDKPDLSDKRPIALVLDMLLAHIPPPRVFGGDKEPFRMLVTHMETNQYLGKVLTGRVVSGSAAPGDLVTAMTRDGEKIEEAKITKIFARRGAQSIALERALAGDIIQLAGLEKPLPTSTLAAPGITRPLFADPIDPPTISMAFGVNDSPLAGREGTKLTSSMLAERLQREAQNNVSLTVLPSVNIPGMSDATEVRARGELQLSILLENMRREGFEISVSPPAVLFKTSSTGEQLEPYEEVVIDVDEEFSGMVIERMAQRKGNMREFVTHGKTGKARLNFLAPSRGLIGFQSELKTESRGTAQIHRMFENYGEYIRGLDRKPRAVMVSNATGQVTAYALDSLQARGFLFVAPGNPTYQGHIIGECSRDSLFDMDVNPVKAKKLTNIRAAGSDDAIRLPPPKVFSLEEAIVYVAPDELVEVTPSLLRLRKRILDPVERDKATRTHAKAMKADKK